MGGVSIIYTMENTPYWCNVTRGEGLLGREYPHLCSPYKIGGFTFKDRMLGSPAGIDFRDIEGFMPDRTIDMYEKVAGHSQVTAD